MSEKSEVKKETLDTTLFWEEVKKHRAKGMALRDAVDLTAVVMGGEYATLVSMAVGKYQEATHELTELSKEERVDEYAIASMGILWHGENFDGSKENVVCTVEEVFTDSLYFILKYEEQYGKDALEKALKANLSVCGDHKAREEMICSVLSKEKE